MTIRHVVRKIHNFRGRIRKKQQRILSDENKKEESRKNRNGKEKTDGSKGKYRINGLLTNLGVAKTWLAPLTYNKSKQKKFQGKLTATACVTLFHSLLWL
jgi:hypothetical protein